MFFPTNSFGSSFFFIKLYIIQDSREWHTFFPLKMYMIFSFLPILRCEISSLVRNWCRLDFRHNCNWAQYFPSLWGMPCDLVAELFSNGDFINIFSPFSLRHALGLGLKEKLPLGSIVDSSTVILTIICSDFGWGQTRRVLLDVLIKTFFSHLSESLGSVLFLP